MFNILSHQGNTNQGDSTLHHSEWLRSNTQAIAHASEAVKKEKHGLISGGIANLYNHSGNQSGIFSEIWK